MKPENIHLLEMKCEMFTFIFWKILWVWVTFVVDQGRSVRTDCQDSLLMGLINGSHRFHRQPPPSLPASVNNSVHPIISYYLCRFFSIYLNFLSVKTFKERKLTQSFCFQMKPSCSKVCVGGYKKQNISYWQGQGHLKCCKPTYLLSPIKSEKVVSF